MRHNEQLCVEIALRIPGIWSSLQQLRDSLPDGTQLTEAKVILKDGSECEYFVLPADEQFPQIFRSSCRRIPTREEQRKVSRYTFCIALSGPGGSLEAAYQMMKAAAVIVEAGGAGVFIDNSGLAHGGQDWLNMCDMGGTDSISYAFVSLVRGLAEVWTMGFQAIGIPDLRMTRHDSEQDPDSIIDIIRYMAASDVQLDDGHLIADEHGPMFKVMKTSCSRFESGSPMHNPFGYLQLVRTRGSVSDN